jgi:hypothetical protein
MMTRAVISLDPGVGVKPTELATAWNADMEAQAVGTARAEESGREELFTGVVELVVVPLLVNVASSVVYDLVKKLVARLRPAQGNGPGLEIAEITTREGDRVVVVRLGRVSS